MKLIGRGWQYSVYDIGGNRVFKRHNTLFESYVEMLKEQLFHLWFPVIGFSKIYKDGKEKASLSLQKIINSSLDQSLFGNPKIIGKFDYEQDFAISLSDYFKNHSLDQSKQKIDSFIEFCLLLYKNSIIEKNFNMANNFGVNNLGKIILIDLGEVCFSTEEIKEQISKRVWLGKDVLNKIPSSLHQYFIQKMNESFEGKRGNG